MEVATSRQQVGVRALKNELSRYLSRVQAGEEVIVTERGRPIARLSPIDPATDRLADLIAAGAVRAPVTTARRRPTRRITPAEAITDLVVHQRR